MKFKSLLTIIVGVVLMFSGCSEPEHQKYEPVRIAISRAVPEKSYKNYIRWLKAADSTVVCIDMYHLGVDSALKVLETCDALLLTGGDDINPERYGEKFDSTKCDLPDNYRDTLEFALIGKALKLKLPIQGICRGHQMLNAYFGGTLYQDIPTDVGTDVLHRHPPYKPANHKVNIVENSMLKDITGVTEGVTNSNHHQAVNRLAPGLKAVAQTDDGLTESVELIDTDGRAYLLGVQWHPEAMSYDDPLSINIAKRFVMEAKKHIRSRLRST
jgi:putative glutamine amidotransferase